MSASASIGGEGSAITLVKGPVLDLRDVWRHARRFPTACSPETRFLSELCLRGNGEWPSRSRPRP